MYPFRCLIESIQMRFFQTNDGLSLLIPIHSCSKCKTNWPISNKCSEYVDATYKISHILSNVYATTHDLGVILNLSLKWFT